MQLDLQIIVIGWAYIDCQIKRPTQKELIVSPTDILLFEIVNKFIT